MVVLGLTVGYWVLCVYIDRFSGGGFGCLRLVVGLLLYFVLLVCVGVSGLVVSFFIMLVLDGFALSGFVALVLVMLRDLGIWFVYCGFCGLRGLWHVGGCACSWLSLVCWEFALRCMTACF